MKLFERTLKIKHAFELGRNVVLEDSRVEITFFQFHQIFRNEEIERNQESLIVSDFCCSRDNKIAENKSFIYSVFKPIGQEKSSGCIVLLHGLNERSWEKYLCWAEYLVLQTGKPVLLFPLAFHMNRSPSAWTDPRWIMPWLRKTKDVDDSPTLTFANYALSDRLIRHPHRFYVSGRETIFNLCQLGREIRTGKHALFSEGTTLDIFAYSIGGLLSQVILQAEIRDLFTESRLFMFCGGSLFNEMNGNSRWIMDQNAFLAMKEYYQNGFLERCASSQSPDRLEKAFLSMIDVNIERERREAFFQKASPRIRVISLKKDRVMTTSGIVHAFGEHTASQILTEMDFDFDYTHEMPFPGSVKTEESLVSQAFLTIFDRAAAFLS